MQVARNFFLTKEKTFTRKFNEALLAFKIEHSLTKDQILELYINQIYLGQRAYGFASAAQVYFGKNLRDLNLARDRDARRPAEGAVALQPGRQSATRQGAPAVRAAAHARSRLHHSRRSSKRRATSRSSWSATSRSSSTRADHFAEMVRQSIYERYQDDAYTRGFKVYTTLVQSRTRTRPMPQCARGVMEYDKRHGYRGAEGYFNLPQGRVRRSTRRCAAGANRER